MTPEERTKLLNSWQFWARPKQLAPGGDWATWLLKAGRGFGKTRAGTGWVNERAEESPGRWIALLAKTPADARDYMIEGPSGFLRTTRPDFCPLYEPSKRRLTWPNGSWATIYSDEEPDQCRGFSGDTAWIDELAKFKNAQECLENLDFGMREVSRDRPRKLITTTPRPIKVINDLEKSTDTIVIVGSSYENSANLSPDWFNKILAKYEGTRLGRQEIHGETLSDNPGALWNHSLIEATRVRTAPCDFRRVVVAIDPAATSNKESDETGIVVAGLGVDNRGYIIEDLTMRGTPKEWATVAVNAYHLHRADRIVAETNNGGEMVETTVRMVDPNCSYKGVHASRGKITRAEPISALYEQKRVCHIGCQAQLEDQMCDYDAKTAKYSPDRMDALVWALTDLMTEYEVGDSLMAFFDLKDKMAAEEAVRKH